MKKRSPSMGNSEKRIVANLMKYNADHCSSVQEEKVNDGYYKDVLPPIEKDVPLEMKQLLTLKESSVYTGIGLNNLVIMSNRT